MKFLQMLVVKKARQRLLPKVTGRRAGERGRAQTPNSILKNIDFFFFYSATKHIPE